MTVNELVETCGFLLVSGDDKDREIESGYVGDLLSDVMGNAPPKCIWMTVQSHQNIIAVASIINAKVVLLCNDRSFEEETLKKANDVGVTLMKTPLTSYEACIELFKAGFNEKGAARSVE